MHEITIRAALARINRKLLRKEWSIHTTRGWEKHSGLDLWQSWGRWHVVDNCGRTADWWMNTKELTHYARRLGVMGSNETIAE